MATIKQCKMLSARCKEAGMEYDFESFKDLENGQVDEKLEEIAQFLKSPKSLKGLSCQSGSEKSNDGNKQIDKATLGMCFKKCFDLILHLGLNPFGDKKRYKEAVKDLYTIHEEIVEEMEGVSPSPSPSFSGMTPTEFQAWTDEQNEYQHPEEI